MFVPVGHARIGIGIEGIHGVVRSGRKNNVVRAPRYRQVRDPQRLRIGRRIKRARKEFAEGRRVDVGGGQRVFLRVDPIAGKIIVIGGDSREVGDPDSRRSAL